MKSVFKSVLKRFVSFILVLVLVLSAVPAIAYAATLTTSVDGLTATYDNGEWTASGSTLSGSAAGTAEATCSSASSTTSTLTLKNSSGSTAVISFNYEKPVIGSGGYVKIDGTSVTSAGAFSKELSNGESVTVVILSGSAGAFMSSVVLDEVRVTVKKTVTTTFVPPAAGGTYTVDGVQITEAYSKTQYSTDPYSLSATPASGYKFIGWYSETQHKIVAEGSGVYGFYSDVDQTIRPVFVLSSDPVFLVGTKFFTDLNEAVSFASSQNIGKIILMKDGTLPAGSYTIPNGKTLLIPFDSLYTVYTTAPEVVYGNYYTPTVFRALTMASGAQITVSSGGAICVASKLSATGTNESSWNGTPSGPYGKIDMKSGSSIVLKSGASLYCYGYISGSGSVTAESGSTVWEAFQIRSWRGGTATSGMKGNSNKVFPMNQYYVQNIEAPLTICSGATERAYTSVNMSGSAYPTSFIFIGSSGMFRLTDGSVTKTYIPSTDSLRLDLNGNAALSSFSMSLAGQSISTSDYVMPINSNIIIAVDSGTTTISQDVALLPGSQVHVASGAAVSIGSGKNVYIYDQDQWNDTFAGQTTKLIPVGYSTANGTAVRRTDSSLVDCLFDVNGTVSVAGKLFTTAGGANVTSSGKTGNVVLTAVPAASATTYQVTQVDTSITYVAISATAARLKNGDGSYTGTAGSSADDTYFYCVAHDKWEKGARYTITFDANDGSGRQDTQTVCSAATALKANSFERSGYTFTGWNTKADGSGTSYADGAEYIATGDVTLYAQWAEELMEFVGFVWTAADGGYTAEAQFTSSSTGVMISVEAAVTSNVTKEATCEEAGSIRYTAVVDAGLSLDGQSHSDEKTVTVPAAGHAVIPIAAIPAACEQAGQIAYYSCLNCGKYFTDASAAVEIAPEDIIVPALGHDYGAPSYSWAADNSSVTASRVCARDAAHVETETAGTTSQITKPAACEAKGETTYTAAFINTAFTTQTKTVENIDALGHDWSAPAYTWAADNSTVTAEIVCGHDASHKITEIADTVYAIVKAATSEEDGSATYTAEFENEMFARQVRIIVLPALGHVFEFVGFTWTETETGLSAAADYRCTTEPDHSVSVEAQVTSVVTVEAACETAGTMIYTASVSAELSLDKTAHSTTNTVSVAALGHEWSGWTVTTEPTCTEAGEENRHCSRCDLTETHELAALGHDYHDVVTDPTCMEDGCTTHTCSRCGDSYIDTQKPALGHDWSEWEVTTTPTCIESGEESRHCSRCDLTERNELAALGHDYHDVVADPTCTEDGYTTHTCSHCGDSYVDAQKPALGHDWSEPVYTWAEDDSSVTASRVCSHDLSHTETETVAAASRTTEATCEEDGQTVCTSGEFENEAFTVQTKTITIPARGHVPGEPVRENEIPATYAEDGSYDLAVYCTVCGIELSREHKTTDMLLDTPVITGLRNEDTSSGITISWMAQSDYSGFRIQRRAEGESKWTTVTDSAVGNSYTDKTAKAGGETYTYRIAGSRDGRWSDYSESASLVRNPFKDVKESASYFKALMWAYNNNIVAGTSTTTFSPNANCTRGQFALMLWRMNSKPSTAGLKNPFTDVKSSSGYYRGIVWCYDQGITAGTSATTYSPNDNIKRWQMILMFWRMRGKPASSLTSNPFTDVKTTASYYKAALWAYENGITGVKQFMPNDLCTRWQLVLFLYRLNNMYHYI